jgi:hypothetical protein
MQFHPVWISSLEHLERFVRIYRTARWWEPFVGYRLPEGTPHLQLLYARVPIVYFANGVLEVADGHASFYTVPRTVLGATIRNVRHPWRFILDGSDLRRVEDFRMKSPMFRYFKLPFVHVTTTQPPPLDDLLLCVGGTGFAMSRIRSQTHILHDRLHDLMIQTVQERG